MEYYVFNLDLDEKEALLAAMSELSAVEAIDLSLQRQLMSNSRQVTLEGGQLGPLLRALDKAIERQESDQGDWVRATEYRRAKGILIAKTRLQFRIMDGGIN